MFRLWVLASVVLSVGLIGCMRSPAYVGMYELVVTKEMQKQMADQLARTSKDDAAAARASMEAALKTTITINADGTCRQEMPGHGGDFKGTYRVDGDKLILMGSDPQSAGSLSAICTFHEAEGTLTMEAGQGETFTFKKK